MRNHPKLSMFQMIFDGNLIFCAVLIPFFIAYQMDDETQHHKLTWKVIGISNLVAVLEVLGFILLGLGMKYGMGSRVQSI